MTLYEKYKKLKRKYILLKELQENKRQINISMLSNGKTEQYIEIDNINNIINIQNKIKTYVMEVYKSPQFKFGLGNDNSDLKKHINMFFKYRYIEMINGIVIANRKHFIYEILSSMNIIIDGNKSYNTIILENRINMIDVKINKYQKIIETISSFNSNKYINRITILLEYIKKLTISKKIIIYLINYINKYYKIYYNPTKNTPDNKLTGKEIENIINKKIIELLQDKIDKNEINCDILYVSNIDYNKMIHNMNCDKNDNNFKQELDGLICIKVKDQNNQIHWYPIIIIESKANLNLIYNDINKLNSLHNRLGDIKNFTINYLENDNIVQYSIMGSGFKNSDLYYCVHEMNEMIDRKYIKFIYDNYYSKCIIYDIIMNKIINMIQCNNINLFTNVEDLDNYIMNILNYMSQDIMSNESIEWKNITTKNDNFFSIMIDKKKTMKNELIENMTKIKSGYNMDNYNRILFSTIYSNMLYNFFNFNKKYKTVYNYLQTLNIITFETIEVIKLKLDEISKPFIHFNTRNDTIILHII